MTTFKITTTGTVSQVSFPDIGSRVFVHPVAGLDMIAVEGFELEELRNSLDVATSLDAGHITVEDAQGGTITTSAEMDAALVPSPHAATHEAGSGDPLVSYQFTSEKNAVNGYAGLDGSSKLTGSQQVYGAAANTATEGNDSRVPTQDENDALAGTDGSPSGLNPYVTDSDARNTNARAPTVHTHDAADINAGTLADARVVQSNVTQHEAAVDHDALTNFDAGEHRSINDAGTGATDLWSANKIGAEIAAAGAGLPVDDTASLVQDPADNTKQVRIDAGAVAAGTTRVLSMPNADITPDDASASRPPLAHNHNAADINAGTLADARVAQSNVTQHEAAIDHDALTNFDAGEHRIINDAGTSGTELWSASKISSITSALTTGYARREKVIDIVTSTAVPPTEVTGDRYVLDFSGAPNAAWDGAAQGDIVEFNGTTWDATTPVEGWITYLDAQNKDALYVDDGTPAWEVRPTIITDHVDLASIGTNSHAQIDTHIADAANPHGTDVGNLGSGTLAELNTAVTDAVLDDASDSRPPTGVAGGGLSGSYPSPSVDGMTGGVLTNDTAHGNRGGGALHADVVAGGADGFMTGADKTKLNKLLETQYQYAERLTSMGVTAGAPVNYLTFTTPVIPAGTYRISWSVVGQNSSASGDWECYVQVDDSIDIINPGNNGRMQEEGIDGGGNQKYVRSAFRDVVLTNTAHTVDLDISQNGSGTATFFFGNIAIERVA